MQRDVESERSRFSYKSFDFTFSGGGALISFIADKRGVHSFFIRILFFRPIL